MTSKTNSTISRLLARLKRAFKPRPKNKPLLVALEGFNQSGYIGNGWRYDGTRYRFSR